MKILIFSSYYIMKKRTIFLTCLGAGAALLGVYKVINKRRELKANKYYEQNIGVNNDGRFNVGNDNVGSFNIGSNNHGFQNLGSDNIGNKNLGNSNTGDKNFGFYNIGKNIFGCFNTKKTPMYLFNKRSNMTMDKWLSSEAHEILCDMPFNDAPVELRQIWYDKLPEQSKNIIKSIDNFNPKIFARITGIDVGKCSDSQGAPEIDNSSSHSPLPFASSENFNEDDEDNYTDSENAPCSSELPFETMCIVNNMYPDIEDFQSK